MPRRLATDATTINRSTIGVLVLIGAVLTAGAVVGVCSAAGWGSVARDLTGVHWIWIAAIAPAAIAVSHAGYTFAYREVARVDGGPELGRREAVALVTSGFGPFSPHSGFALDVGALTRLGVPAGEARVRVLLLGTLEYAVLAPATLVAAACLLAYGRRAQAGVLPSWVIGVPAGAVLALGLLAVYRLSDRRWPPWKPARNALEAINMTGSMLRSWPAGPLSGVGMGLYWTGDIAALIACVAAFRHGHITVPALVVGYATGYALTRRGLPLAGAGAVEAMLPFALSWVGVPLGSAVLAVIAYRLFNLWVVLPPAIFALRALRRRHRAKAPTPAVVTVLPKGVLARSPRVDAGSLG